MTETETRLREALTKAAEKFDEYARLHRAKGTKEGFEKAAANQRMAIMCYEALNTDYCYYTEAKDNG